MGDLMGFDAAQDGKQPINGNIIRIHKNFYHLMAMRVTADVPHGTGNTHHDEKLLTDDAC